MKKILSGSCYIVLLLGVLFVVGSFLFATNEIHFRKGEIAGHQQITPQSITQVDEMTKEYIFSGEQLSLIHISGSCKTLSVSTIQKGAAIIWRSEYVLQSYLYSF